VPLGIHRSRCPGLANVECGVGSESCRAEHQFRRAVVTLTSRETELNPLVLVPRSFMRRSAAPSFDQIDSSSSHGDLDAARGRQSEIE
jgi:hypothetical protein